jgi:hypothetical protein
MTAFELIHVLLRQQKVTMSLSPQDFFNSAADLAEKGEHHKGRIKLISRFRRKKYSGCQLKL